MESETELDVFCRNVQYLRQKSGYTQKHMAQILNISTGSLRKLERGIIPRCIHAGTIYRICTYFDISADWLLSIDMEHEKTRCE